ncbi:hypothetical protein U9R90_12940 [Streptomyces sp. E11-3]|uniref:hypothetical protein n=1 Tax=Streptomyces sp. E11-3 TaxID=3110112 RepID=UPI0039817EEC
MALAATAVLMTALAACGSSGTKKYCVDEDDFRSGRGYRVIDKKHCESSGSKGSDSSKLTIKGISDPEWYYNGKKKKGRAKNGTFDKPS